MFIPGYEYHRPETVEEASSLLSSLKGKVTVFAGGTEIIVDMKKGNKFFDHLIALGGISDLKAIEIKSDDLLIGAMVTPGLLARSGPVLEKFPEISEVTDVFAAVQVGNRATIGGNIAAAVPSADFPPILMALYASVEIFGSNGKRTVALERVFTGPRTTILEKEEVITGIRLPLKNKGMGAKYVKFGLRESLAVSVAGVAAMVQLEDGVCKNARIVLGAVAPTPLLVEEAGEFLKGRKFDDDAIEEAGKIVGSACSPISDIRCSKDFRREIVETLTKRALNTAVERARANV